jgi:hypothetical protein
MDLISLRRKNKTLLVDCAFSVFDIAQNESRKKEWIDFMVAGGDVKEMILALKKQQGNAYCAGSTTSDLSEILTVEEFISRVEGKK